MGVRRRGSTYTAYWWLRGPNGKYVQRSKGGFHTVREARSFLNEALAAAERGQTAYSGRMTVEQFLTRIWLPSLVCKKSTLTSYSSVVHSHLVPHLGALRLNAVTPSDVNAMLAKLQAAGRSARTRQYVRTVLRMALTAAERQGLLSRNVASLSTPPRRDEREFTVWNVDQTREFLASVAEDRLYAAWSLFLSLGPRRGEVCGLRWDDVNLDSAEARINRSRGVVAGQVEESEPKTRASRRTLPLDPGLVRVLRAHKARQAGEKLAAGPAWQETGYVFTEPDGRPVHPGTMSERWDAVVKRSSQPRIRLHGTRHVAAVGMIQEGIDVAVVARVLGHSSASTTQSTYQRWIPSNLVRDAVTKRGATLFRAPSVTNA